MQPNVDCARRLFSNDYSSSGQRHWQDVGGATWYKTLQTQLRCDVITSECLVIPDTHLFDGAFFMSSDPIELATALGKRSEPKLRGIVLRLRHRTIRDTLMNWLVRDGSDNLNEFPFKLIQSRHIRTQIKKKLGATSRARWEEILASCNSNPALALGQLLRDCIAKADLTENEVEQAKDVAALAERGWARWLEVGDRLFHCEGWDRPFDIWGALQCQPIGNGLKTNIGTQLYDQTVEGLVSGGKYRADLTKMVDDIRATTDDADVIGDCNLVEHWYSRGRYRAMAEQHNCAFAYDPANADGSQTFGIEPSKAQYPVGSIAAFPEGFQQALLSASGEHFGEAVDAASLRLNSWWHKGNFDDLRHAVDVLSEKLGVKDGRSTRQRFQSYFGVGISSIGFTATFAAAEPSSITAFGSVFGCVVGVGAIWAEAGAHIQTQTARNRIVEVLQRRLRPSN